MPIITLHALSPKRQEAIRALHALCRQAEPLTLSCPEDADAYWLYTDGADELLSLLAAWQTEPGLWECCGFTRPDCRRQGYFYALLDAACGEGGILSQDDILFVADGRSADADYLERHAEDLVQFGDLTSDHWAYDQIMEATNAHAYDKVSGGEDWTRLLK